MTPLDWIIVAFTALMALWGYGQGLVAGGLALAGFAGGAVAGSRLGPLLLDDGSASPYAPLLALVGALFVGALLASVMEVLGFRIRRRLGDRLGVLDGAGGAVLVGALGLGMAWIVGAVALHTPGAGSLRESFQRSAIMAELNAALPPSGPILRTLARFDPFPRIEGPGADVPPPTSAIARDRDVRAAGRGVVRVLGTACGLGVQGSGWIAGEGLVVTNAHVVAGQDDTKVQLRGEGEVVDADAIWFDVRNDVALLRASGISAGRPLTLADDAERGTSSAVLGFPLNGPYHVSPARLGATQPVVSQDAYGRGPVQRPITSLRGLVRSGNSGGPVVDDRGRVLATVFAAAESAEGRSGFAVPNDVVRGALERAGGPVETGPSGM
ncbi:MAG: MarP family serine protease [Thermoleophilaceae bacterium]